MNQKQIVIGVVVLAVVLFGVFAYPKVFKKKESFTMFSNKNSNKALGGLQKLPPVAQNPGVATNHWCKAAGQC